MTSNSSVASPILPKRSVIDETPLLAARTTGTPASRARAEIIRACHGAKTVYPHQASFVITHSALAPSRL